VETCCGRKAIHPILGRGDGGGDCRTEWN
jgi:hypothetical protein